MPLPEERVFCTAGSAGRAGLPHRPVTDDAVHLARHRIADRIAADRIGRLVDEYDAVREQPFEGRGAVVGKGADDLAVVVAVVGKAVRTDHRPVGQIAEQEVRRIRDAVFLLDAGAAAERNIAAADDGVAADIASRPRQGSPSSLLRARRSRRAALSPPRRSRRHRPRGPSQPGSGMSPRRVRLYPTCASSSCSPCDDDMPRPPLAVDRVIRRPRRRTR